ncbi:hypothetical protein BF49_4513 [Bradyrhizobium sp.]|uniref:hypothetical protein n=1 Tax=Bradyrhizobium sp. TaxID=376 RepID=UPI0007C1B8E8|nr:hypothetical protein [Bradyrhizobium sp.]CUT13433.1 hypothetical protein BF49_4513 [Bradyrhizobium sp.]
MSLEEKALRNDIESYLRGEEPPAKALAKAPRLEQWAPGITGSPYSLVLRGLAVGHQLVPNWKSTETAEVVWLDRKGRWARTRRMLWKLGQPEGREIPVDGVDL